jgi:hypothetical protein
METGKFDNSVEKINVSIGWSFALLALVACWVLLSVVADTVNQQNAALATARGIDAGPPFAEMLVFLKWCAFFGAICALAAVRLLIAKTLRL